MSEEDFIENLDRYYDCEELEGVCVGGNLKIFHQNIRSFNQNFDQLSVFMNKSSAQLDVIVLSETWFSEFSCSNIEGYLAYHTYRDGRAGGGISIFVRKGLASHCLPDKSYISDVCESCVVEVCPDPGNSHESILIFGIYRPPNAPMNDFIEYIDSLAHDYFGKCALFLGDFNIDTLNEEISSDFTNVMLSNYFFPLINKPTRVTDNSATCIDHMWYNRHNVLHSGTFLTDFSDHFLIFCVIKMSIDRTPVRKIIRDHSVCNIELLKNRLRFSLYDSFVFDSLADVNEKTNYFLDTFWHIYDITCPKTIKSISYKKICRPWISDELVDEINYKHILFKQYKQSIVPFHVFNNYKNKLKSKLRTAKSTYYKTKFSQIRGDSRENWKAINVMLGKDKTPIKCNNLLDKHGNIVSNPVDISNLFCDHFSTVASTLDSQIPVTNENPMDYMTDNVINSFYVKPSSTEEITHLILNLKNKGCKIDQIPVSVYKNVSDVISPIIKSIFDSSIAEGSFPELLKTARTVPIFKSKSHNLVNNYRPISILHVLSKIIEKLMKDRVMSYLSKENIIYKKQYGFRPGYSTSDAVVEVVDKCVSCLDDRKFTIAVFLDLSKAFDTVNRNILIRKMERLGFRGVVSKWLDSYLTNRKMYVDIDGHRSTTRTLNIGLPQGAVSSTYLFSLYINDMHRSSEKLDFTHFADDTTLCLSGDNLESLCREVSTELCKVSKWLKINRLSLNIEKSCFMLFTHRNTTHIPISIAIDGVTVKQSDTVKFLGICLDNRLSYNDHVLMMTKRLSRAVGVMKKIKSLVTYDILKQMYYALFNSILSYGIIVWGGCGVTNRLKICKVQDRALALLAELSPSTPHPPLFSDFYRCNIVIQFHKYVFSSALSEYFHSKIVSLLPNHDYMTRYTSSDKYLLPSVRKTVTQKQFLYNAVNEWNKLPQSMKQITNIKKFKVDVKKYLYCLE